MKKIYYLFALFFVFVSCEKDEIALSYKSSKTKNLEKYFKASEFEGILPENYDVAWRNSSTGIVEGLGEIIEIPLRYTSISRNKNANPLTYKIVGIKKEGEQQSYNFYLAKFLHQANKETDVSLFDFQNFSGLLKVIDSSKNPLLTQIYHNGKLLANTNPISEEEYEARLNSKYVQEDCYTIKTEYWTDYYTLSGEFIGSHLDNVTYETYCTDGGGGTSGPGTGGGGYGGGGTGGPGGSGTTTYIDRTNEKLDLRENGPDILMIEKGTTFENNDKINCTFVQLMQATSLKDILTDFFGDAALFDITFKVKENLICNGNANITGCTRKLNDFTYEVIIDEAYINSPATPTIFLAQTIIHEAIHANLFAAVVKLNNGTVPMDTGFAALYEEYRNKKNWSHEFMADKYTGLMEEAIREVHPHLNDSGFLNGYENNSLWDWNEFYEYMSYRGLQDTERGKEYYSTNLVEIRLYQDGAAANSTTNPNCN